MIKICKTCEKEFSVSFARRAAKYCSAQCRQDGLKAKPNTVCSTCGKEFHIKKSQKIRYKRTLGYFCSNVCFAKAKSSAYLGSENPNYRGVQKNHDGYFIDTNNALRRNGVLETTVHRAVACEKLGVIKIGKSIHVHHRDCDILNNMPSNIAVLTVSDHKWLHKNFGNTVLWAFQNKLISLEQLKSWSREPAKAEKLLTTSVEKGIDNENFTVINGVLEKIK